MHSIIINNKSEASRRQLCRVLLNLNEVAYVD